MTPCPNWHARMLFPEAGRIVSLACAFVWGGVGGAVFVLYLVGALI